MTSFMPPFVAQNMEQLSKRICKGEFHRIPNVKTNFKLITNVN